MKQAADLLRPDKPILFDGGIGTELMKRGLGSGEPPELWNLEHPGQVIDVHRAYIEAGAQVIGTNTFGANAVRLRTTGEKVSAGDLINAGCGLATEAAVGRALVMGTLGPLGENVEPYGPITIGEARDAFSEAVETMMSCGVDMLLIETMTTVDEAQIALRQAMMAGVSLVAVSMNFSGTPEGPRTASGESPADVARELQHTGAHIIGSNCGDSLQTMTSVARELSSVATVPVLIQANAGMPVTRPEGLQYPETPVSFAAFVRSISDMGIRLIGGCCGTTPEYIRQARKMLG